MFAYRQLVVGVALVSATAMLQSGAVSAAELSFSDDQTNSATHAGELAQPPIDDFSIAAGIDEFMMTPEQRRAVGDDGVMRNQETLQEAIDALLLSSDGTGTEYPLGYTGGVVNPATLQMDLWWVGGVPSDIAERLAEVAPTVEVRSHETTVDRITLLAERDRVFRPFPEGVVSVSPRVDGDGFVVQYDDRIQPDLARIEGLSAYRVRAIPGRLEETATYRYADASPYKAGALHLAQGAVCTTAFAIDRGTIASRRMFSASHCDDDGPSTNRVYGGDEHYFVNTGATFFIRQIDIRVMNATGPAGGGTSAPFSFVGGINSSSGSALPIAGAYYSEMEGSTVAASGANSGLHIASITSTEYDAVCDYGNGAYPCVQTRARAEDLNGVASSGGDSGGPVLNGLSNGTAIARGIISKGESTNFGPPYPSGFCNGTVTQTGTANNCARSVIYTPVWRALRSVNTVALNNQAPLFRIATN